MNTTQAKLHIEIRGEYYTIDKDGNITRDDMPNMESSDNWKFLGVSTHHWQNNVVHSFSAIWNEPQLAINGYVWDRDHGTTRTWGGKYCGRIPRITKAWKN